MQAHIVIPSSSHIPFRSRVETEAEQYRLHVIPATHSTRADATTNSSIIAARGRYLNVNVGRFVYQQDYLYNSTSAKLLSRADRLRAQGRHYRPGGYGQNQTSL